jgi:hypothetical protein
VNGYLNCTLFIIVVTIIVEFSTYQDTLNYPVRRFQETFSWRRALNFDLCFVKSCLVYCLLCIVCAVA